jgi:hypothetical protein
MQGDGVTAMGFWNGLRVWPAASAIGLIGLVAAPAAAQPVKGERVPVSYLVDRQDFRNLAPGEAILFELHSDPDCSEAVDSETVYAGAAPDLFAEVVSGREIGEATPAGRRPIRLRYTLQPSSASRRLYLRVIGAHVTPVGSACQAQAASIQEDLPDSLERLRCADGSVARWYQARGSWDCAPALRGMSCASVSSTLTGGASPFVATATCPPGTVRTGGGHFGVSPGDTVLDSAADASNGWFCAVAGATPSGSCQALCCALE